MSNENKVKFLNQVRFNPYLVAFVPNHEVRDFIACQFALESNFGTSEIANFQKNYCGMKRPYRRHTLCLQDDVSKLLPFACYEDLTNCIQDYILLLLYNRPNQSELNYLSSFKIFLRNIGYCPEMDYIDRINFIYNQLNSQTL